MKKIRDLVVISGGFPNPKTIYKYKFLEQIVNEFVREGIHVTVISPIFCNHIREFYKSKWSYATLDRKVKVFQPLILNFTSKKIGELRLGKLSYLSFKKAVARVIRKEKLRPDALYSHFITPAGCTAAEIGTLLGIPAFCAVGESHIEDDFIATGKSFIVDKFKNITGIISVSTENKEKMGRLNVSGTAPVIVLPNGVNQNEFYPHDRTEARIKYGFDQEEVLGIFVGAFIDRKGVKRVEKASEVANVKMIYVGSGEQDPVGNKVVFKGIVSHIDLPVLLSTADFFVLPTREEGCCNAIIEAIACGLPIISSKGKFNDDILSPEYAIRVDPDSIDELSDAMRKLSIDKTVRQSMSEGAIRSRIKFDINVRAKKIIAFMEECGA